MNKDRRIKWLKRGLAATFVLVALAAVAYRFFPWINPMKPDFAVARERWIERLGPDVELPLPDARIVVSKSARTLDLYSGENKIVTYPVVFGRHPEGHKLRKGDHRTPEGEYFLCTRNGRSVFHLFLGVSYPNAADARAALARGEITREQCEDFESADRARRRPDWEGPLGGAIGVHGGGLGRDWTLGCIATENENIEELWLATRMGTPITILP